MNLNFREGIGLLLGTLFVGCSVVFLLGAGLYLMSNHTPPTPEKPTTEAASHPNSPPLLTPKQLYTCNFQLDRIGRLGLSGDQPADQAYADSINKGLLPKTQELRNLWRSSGAEKLSPIETKRLTINRYDLVGRYLSNMFGINQYLDPEAIVIDFTERIGAFEDFQKYHAADFPKLAPLIRQTQQELIAFSKLTAGDLQDMKGPEFEARTKEESKRGFTGMDAINYLESIGLFTD